MQSLPVSSSDTPESRDVATLLEQISAKGSGFIYGDSRSRGELLALAKSLCTALETPMEAILRMGWAQVTPITLLDFSRFLQCLIILVVANS
jgi:hypothetical protein